MTMTPPDSKEAVAKNDSISNGLNRLRDLDLKQIIFGHTPLVLVDQAMVSGVNFLVGILLARLLGVAEYGCFVLAFSAVLLLNSIQMSLILSPMMVLGAKKNQDEQPAYFGAVLMQQICFALLSIFFILGGGFLLVLLVPKWHVGNLLLPLAGVAVGSQTQGFFRRYCFTRIQAKGALLLDGVYYGGQVLILAFLSWHQYLTPKTALLGMAVAGLTATIVGWIRARGQLVFNLSLFKKTAKSHWDFGKWLGGSAVLQWFSGQLFIYVAAAYLSASAAGAIKAAQNIVGVTHILFLGMENFVPTRASQILHTSGRKALNQYLKKVALWGGIATGTICLVAASAPGFWMELLYGGQYGRYANVLLWLCGAYLLSFFAKPLGAGLRALENTKPFFKAYISMALFSLTCSVPLIKYFSLNGAMFGIAGVNLILVSVLSGTYFTHISNQKEF